MVCWRDPANRTEQGITLPTESEAITLKRLLDAWSGLPLAPSTRIRPC